MKRKKIIIAVSINQCVGRSSFDSAGRDQNEVGEYKLKLPLREERRRRRRRRKMKMYNDKHIH